MKTPFEELGRKY